MKTTNKIEDTIVAFHTGRGGQFYNAGHVTFLGERRIDEFTGDLFLKFENEDEIRDAIGDRPNLLDKFEECQMEEDFSFFIKLGFDAGELIYTDCDGNPVGLTLAESNTGVGTIDIDGEYDTTSADYLKNWSDESYRLILDSSDYVDDDIIQYCKWELGIE